MILVPVDRRDRPQLQRRPGATVPIIPPTARTAHETPLNPPELAAYQQHTDARAGCPIVSTPHDDHYRGISRGLSGRHSGLCE
jgi:hypothetical protein